MFLTLNQLNDQIENLSKEKNAVPQIILWQFMAGRLLERISLSRYADRIILKSGLLEIFIIGLEVRSLPGKGTAATGCRGSFMLSWRGGGLQRSQAKFASVRNVSMP